MGRPGFEVDPEQLRGVASKMAQSVEDIRKARAAREPDLAVPAGHGSGWATTDATQAAAVSWGGFLDRLASSVDQVAAGLRASVDSYLATDAATATDLRKQLAE